jgi:GcrA cell cycle regulator
VSRNAVIGKIHRLGLAQGRPTPPGRPPPETRRAPRGRPPRILRAIYAEAPFCPAVAVVDARATRCSLLELAQDRCHWPIGEPGQDDFAYCGNGAIAGLPYCAGHARFAYRLSARRA